MYRIVRTVCKFFYLGGGGPRGFHIMFLYAYIFVEGYDTSMFIQISSHVSLNLIILIKVYIYVNIRQSNSNLKLKDVTANMIRSFTLFSIPRKKILL